MDTFKVDFFQDGYRPPLSNYLLSVAEGEYNYNRLGLRHPLGIFNISVSSVIQSMNALSKKSESVRDLQLSGQFLKLLISDFWKFYDSCWEILRCFTGCEKKVQTEPKHVAIKANFPDTHDLFWSQINDDDDFNFLRNLSNELKHSSNKIVVAQLSNEIDYVSAYFLEIPDGNSGIHFDQGYYPVSFTVEFNRIAYLIYKISDLLLSSIQYHLKNIKDHLWI